MLSEQVRNWIGGAEVPARAGETFAKVSPHDGRTIAHVARSRSEDVAAAVDAAKSAYPAWSSMPPVQRGDILFRVAFALRAQREEVARVVALETGKSLANALGETDGAIALALFMAGEGQRLYGRTTTSGTPNKYAMTVRQPLGVAGLIIAANTPIANVAWKVFPALVCGNTAVLKAAEDTPATAWIFARIAAEAGLPAGVLNVVHGFGEEAGAPLVAHPDVAVISFTGSTAVGREIAVVAGRRLARVSLELGGKNPLIVCHDADLEQAVKWSLLSAFSNAGQRCASGSRLIVFDAVYDRFRDLLVERASKLRVGPADDDDFGPVINEEQLACMLAAVDAAAARGAKVLCGGTRLTGPAHASGFYLAPTLIENVTGDDDLSRTELFGPISCLYRVRDFDEALALANDSPYGLTACIHTASVHRALEFTRRIQAGVAIVNAGTFGSEPHMPFGGVKQSGNGSREPGTEALDIYSNLKDVYMSVFPDQL
ncbi:MAG TPA: aldehyde dehydrogenase family protein [Thermoanaerobaculia bacterium]|nr:aldehyde dehydrogenase family protein [Thermoanaerobaculia bacterium]